MSLNPYEYNDLRADIKELENEVKVLRGERDTWESKCRDTEDELCDRECEVDSLKHEVNQLERKLKYHSTGWDLDISSDGTPILTADGQECPSHIMRELRLHIECQLDKEPTI
jgi:predicted RNase H-like nuclease (RuvC/YqgF family)